MPVVSEVTVNNTYTIVAQSSHTHGDVRQQHIGGWSEFSTTGISGDNLRVCKRTVLDDDNRRDATTRVHTIGRKVVRPECGIANHAESHL
jgi:hypothetical protein